MCVADFLIVGWFFYIFYIYFFNIHRLITCVLPIRLLLLLLLLFILPFAFFLPCVCVNDESLSWFYRPGTYWVPTTYHADNNETKKKMYKNMHTTCIILNWSFVTKIWLVHKKKNIYIHKIRSNIPTRYDRLNIRWINERKILLLRVSDVKYQEISGTVLPNFPKKSFLPWNIKESNFGNIFINFYLHLFLVYYRRIIIFII